MIYYFDDIHQTVHGSLHMCPILWNNIVEFNKNPETDFEVQPEQRKMKTASLWLFPLPQSHSEDSRMQYHHFWNQIELRARGWLLCFLVFSFICLWGLLIMLHYWAIICSFKYLWRNFGSMQSKESRINIKTLGI